MNTGEISPFSIKSNTMKKTKKQEIIEFIRFAVIAMLIVIPIRMFIAQPFIVNGESMYPTFDNGDYLIIDEITYRNQEPERGDVVVFKFPSDESRFLIKRVIALPGETVTLRGGNIIIADGEEEITLNEPYIRDQYSTYGSWSLSDDEYFVLGDNRNASSDSRSWGLLKRDHIVGKTFLRLFPLSGIGSFPGEVEPEVIENQEA